MNDILTTSYFGILFTLFTLVVYLRGKRGKDGWNSILVLISSLVYFCLPYVTIRLTYYIRESRSFDKDVTVAVALFTWPLTALIAITFAILFTIRANSLIKGFIGCAVLLGMAAGLTLILTLAGSVRIG